MISYTTVLCLGVKCLDGTVKIGDVFGVDLAHSLGNLELLGSVGGVENAEILAVGSGEEDIVSAFGEKTQGLTFGNTHMSDYLTAALKMSHRLGAIV